jgi:hypothetical protein
MRDRVLARGARATLQAEELGDEARVLEKPSPPPPLAGGLQVAGEERQHLAVELALRPRGHRVPDPVRPEAFSDEFLRVAVADHLAHAVGPEQRDELLDRGIGAQRGAPLADKVEDHVVALRVRDREREAIADAS